MSRLPVFFLLYSLLSWSAQRLNPMEGLGCLKGLQYDSTRNGPLLEAVVPVTLHGRNLLDTHRNMTGLHLGKVGHLRVEISEFQWQGMTLRRYRPRMKDGLAPELNRHFFGREEAPEISSWNDVPVLDMREKYRELEAQGRGEYEKTVEQLVTQGTDEMKHTQGFKEEETEKLKELAHEFTAYSTYFEVIGDNGESLGTFRVIDAPYGVVNNLNSGSPKKLLAHIGPAVASFELSPSQLDMYHYLTSDPDTMYGPPYDTQATPFLQRPQRSPQELESDTFLFQQLLNFVDAQQGKPGLQHRGDIVRQLMLEKKFQKELIAQGMEFGLLPRPGLNSGFFHNTDPIYLSLNRPQELGITFAAGMISEPGNFSIKQTLSSDDKRKVNSLLMSGFLMHVLDEGFTPEFNGGARSYATYGNSIAEELYRKYYGFRATTLSVPFNNGESHILIANPYEVVLKYLDLNRINDTPLRKQTQDFLKQNREDFVLVHFLSEHGKEFFE